MRMGIVDWRGSGGGQNSVRTGTVACSCLDKIIPNLRSGLPLSKPKSYKRTITRQYKMVRLITHNLLACHVKGCESNNFPLAFANAQVEIREADYNPDFLKGFYPKIEYNALVTAARQVCRLRPCAGSQSTDYHILAWRCILTRSSTA